ncbi:hybrid sensor histidine kinase/response regulator [Methyloversatilis thermotolerans]|uniref:hybrid sensor histidine kinase/response regulator n=1 Tax=Methyloversatilis thermotolerans TaxID=1346290 RepID=UPI0003631B71|nr:ATP-binding protein [Methyloversatilis thermotolerans]
MKRWGIRQRVLLVALAPMLVFGIAASIWVVLHRLSELENTLLERGRATARQVAATADYGVFSGNTEALVMLIEAARREPDISGIMISSRDGDLVVSGGHLSPPAYLPGERPPSLSVFELDHSLMFVEPIARSAVLEEDMFDGLGELATDRRPAGWVLVEVSRQRVDALKRDFIVSSALFAAGAMLVASLFAIRISSTVTRPVREVSRAVRRIGEGDLGVRVSHSGGGSLRVLVEGVNAMAERLMRSRDEMEARIADATRQLRTRTDEAERANHAKSRFLAAASHDLRQPMHALGLFVAELAERLRGSEHRRLIRQIEESVGAMEDLLDALLDMSKLDAGGVTARRSEFALQPMLSRLVDDFNVDAVQRGLRLKLRPTSLWVESDPVLLERIMINLLSNAVRYTQRGSVLVAARRRGDHVDIEVRDSGPGIPAEAHDMIFEEFYQLQNPARARGQGLGLGLAIVKRLTQLLGHDVTIRSRPGEGSVFALRVPVVREPVDAVPDTESEAADEVLTLTVVVIDDDAGSRAGISGLLESWGCEVMCSASLSEARDVIRQHDRSPALILCDFRLAAVASGIDVLDALLAEQTGEVAAALVTGDTDPLVRRLAAARGYPVLHKPVRPARLRALVQQVAQRHRNAVG